MALGPDDAGAACLLIHGFVGSRRDFADLGVRLADAGFYVQLMRLPGHGTTPREFAALGPEDLLAAAREECRDLLARFDRVYVIGFSMGGAITTILSSEENENLAGAVLISPYYKVTYYPYYILPPMTWNAIFSPVMPYVIKGDAFVRVNRREAVAHIFSYRVVPTKGAKTLEALGRQARDPQTLEKITVPLLMVQAEGDEAASPKAGREAFERIRSPDKTHRMFSERSNHHLLWDYEAEEAKAVILEFLERQEAAARADTAGSPADQSSSAAQAP